MIEYSLRHTVTVHCRSRRKSPPDSYTWRGGGREKNMSKLKLATVANRKEGVKEKG